MNSTHERQARAEKQPTVASLRFEAAQRELFDYASRLQAESATKPPFRNIEGLWANLGVSLSAEEIDENQREMWRNFPREDI